MDPQTELHQRLAEIGSHIELAAKASGGATFGWPAVAWKNRTFISEHRG